MREAVSRLEESGTGALGEINPGLSPSAFVREFQRRIEEKLPARREGEQPAWTIGIGEIDACLPDGRMSRAGLHEIEPMRPLDMPALAGFTLGLVARLGSSLPVIWCVSARQANECGHLYGFGLDRYGVSPGRIVSVRISKARQMLFAMEEALKTRNVAAVIGEGAEPDFTASRRLALLCADHRIPCLVLSPAANERRGSAAAIRWRIAAHPGVEDRRDPRGPGLPTWQAALARARGASMPPPSENVGLNGRTPYPWRVTWDEQTHSFRPASVFSGGAVSEGQQRRTTFRYAATG